MNFRLYPLCFFVLTIISCHSVNHADNNKVRIRLSADSQSVYISGLQYAILNDLKTDTANTTALQSILAIYRMPADADLKDIQQAQPGKYLVTDTAILFKPDTAFAKNQRYFVRYYGGPLVNDTRDLLNSKAKLQGQHYTEVVLNF